MMGGYSFPWLLMVLVWVFIIAGAIWLALTVAGRDGRRSNAEDILAERFARGEIDDEEFRKRRAALREPR